MMSKKAVLLGAFVLLMFSTFVYKNDICCMFNATRYYGWPSPYIVVSKTTELLDEAKKIESESLIELINDGWQVRFVGNYTKRIGISSYTVVNLITNYLFYLGVAHLLVKFFRRL